jgi:hypothetical protein
MSKSVKIQTLTAPPLPLDDFDPGKYLSELTFVESDTAITDQDRDGLAQFAHYLAFLALKAKSTRWHDSVVDPDSLAYQALESHFGHLADWPAASEAGLSYRQLATFLMRHYPPRLPGK